jgi:hypothetical protein
MQIKQINPSWLLARPKQIPITRISRTNISLHLNLQKSQRLHKINQTHIYLKNN